MMVARSSAAITVDEQEEQPAPVARKRRAGGDRTRANLLDAALLIWSRSGIASVTMEAVATEAGRTRGIVYHHFAARAELIEATRDHLHDQLADLFTNQGPTAADPYGFVAGLGVDSPELILSYIRELLMRKPREDRLIQSGTVHFRDLAERGRLRETIDPEHATVTTVGMWLAAVLAVGFGDTPQKRRLHAKGFARTFELMMRQGLLIEPGDAPTRSPND